MIKKKRFLALAIIIIINVGIFILGNVIKIEGIELNKILINKYALLLGGRSEVFVQEKYRLFTSIFFHSDFNHIYNNLITLVIFGYYLSLFVSNIEFLFIYFFGGFFADLFSIWIYKYTNPDKIIYSIGSSGCVYAIMGAILLLLIYVKYMKGNTVKINTKIFFIIVLLGIFFGGSAVVNNVAHLGGFITGLILMLFIILIKRIGRRTQING